VRNDVEQVGVLGIVAIADRALPEPGIVTGDVQIPKLPAELIRLGMRMVLVQVLEHEVPPMDHRDARCRLTPPRFGCASAGKPTTYERSAEGRERMSIVLWT